MTAPWHRAAPAGAEVETDDDELLTVDRWPREVFAPHWHDEFNWIVPMRPGRIALAVDGEELALDGDTWACIFPRTPHTVLHISDDTEVLGLFVPPLVMERAWRATRPRPAIERRVLVGGRADVARGLALAWSEQRLADRRADAFDRAFAFALAGWLWRVGEAPRAAADAIAVRLRGAAGPLGDQGASFLQAHLAQPPFPRA